MSRMLLLSLSLLFIAILFLGCADIPEETTNMSPQNPTMTTNTPIQIPTDAKVPKNIPMLWEILQKSKMEISNLK